MGSRPKRVGAEMTDETQSVEGSVEEQKDEGQQTVDDKTVRSHPFFKKITAKQKEDLNAAKSELAELRAERERHQAEIEAAKAAEEGRLKEHYEAQISQLQSTIESFDSERMKIATEYELKIAAANKGITSPIIQKGLLAEYLALEGEEKPQPDAWIDTLASDETNAGLFSSSTKQPIGAGLGGKPQTRGAETVSLSERLKDPTDVEAFRIARERVARGESLD